MYKLKSLKATHFIGFRSGLSKKTVKFDLTPLLDKNIIIILGDNGMGKSTFASLIPPLHEPFGVNKSFIEPGKEGLLVREYINEEGKILVTRCVYSPKKDKGHSTKAFIGILGSDGEYIELNPEGTIGSYLDIVEKEFKVNKASLQLTYYDDNIKDLVKMTRSERVNNINKFIVANKRYNLAYTIINDKHKSARTIMRNITQKLAERRESKYLDRLLSEIEEYINRKSERYEETITKISKLEGAIEAKLQGRTTTEFAFTCEEKMNELKKLTKELKRLEELVSVDQDVKKVIPTLERQIFEVEFEQKNSKLTSLQESLYSMEEELSSYEEVQGYSKEEADELKESLRKLDETIASIEYSKNPELYDKIVEEEVDLLIQVQDEIEALFDAGISQYGSEFYKTLGALNLETLEKEIKSISAKSEALRLEKNKLRLEYDDIYKYKAMAEVLNLRPKECQIETCKFISGALQASVHLKRIQELEEGLHKVEEQMGSLSNILERSSALRDISYEQRKITERVDSYGFLFEKYYSLRPKDFLESLKMGLYPEQIDPDSLKILLGIISERDQFRELIQKTRPALIQQIQWFEQSQKGARVLIATLERLSTKIEETRKNIVKEREKFDENQTLLKKLREELVFYQEVQTALEEREEVASQVEKLWTEVEENTRIEKEITEQISHIRDLNEEKEDINKELSKLYKERDVVKFENIEVKRYKLEMAEIETDFLILDILRQIVQPGSGITKDTIDIFLEDIRETANVLISKTFNGKLSLDKFIINENTFDMPFIFNGTRGEDLSDASSSQRSIGSSCISLAILSTLLDGYSTVIYDEPDKTFSPQNREEFIKIICEYTKYIGINSNYIITHSPEFYEGYDVGFILFPGHRLTGFKKATWIEPYK